MMETNVKEFEAKIEIVYEKNDDKMDAVTTLNETIGKQSNNEYNKALSKILEVPAEVWKAIQEVKKTTRKLNYWNKKRGPSTSSYTKLRKLERQRRR